MKSITYYAHLLLKDKLKKNHVVIDATIGNGLDTLFLCENVKLVHGFDIQELAIKNTTTRLNQHTITNYRLYLDSFINYQKYVNHFDGIIFNLGYLPNSDSGITTLATDIVTMLESLLNLKHKFFIMITVYPGHNEGLKESQSINNFLDKSNIRYLQLTIENTKKLSPYIILFDKD